MGDFVKMDFYILFCKYTMLYIIDFIKEFFKNQGVPFQNIGQWHQLFLKG